MCSPTLADLPSIHSAAWATSGELVAATEWLPFLISRNDSSPGPRADAPDLLRVLRMAVLVSTRAGAVNVKTVHRVHPRRDPCAGRRLNDRERRPRSSVRANRPYPDTARCSE